MLAKIVMITARKTANDTAASAAPDRDRYRSRSRRASLAARGARAASRESTSTKNGASSAHATTHAIRPPGTSSRVPPDWPPFRPPEANRASRPTPPQISPGFNDLAIRCGGCTRPEIAATVGTLLTARPGQAAAMTAVAIARITPMTSVVQDRLSGSVRCAVAISRCG